MKNNLLFVGLDDVFNKHLAKKISDELSLYFLDVKDMIEYDLINSGAVIKTCGLEYFKKQENKILRNLTTYENSLINITYDHLVQNKSFEKFKENSFVIYGRIKKEQLSHHINCEYVQNVNGELVINLIAYNDRNKLLESIADLIVDLDLDNVDKSANEIINKLEGV